MSNILITGASKGIGFETVVKLAKEQENRIIAVSRDHKKLLQLKKTCEDSCNNRITVVRFDITDDKDIKRLEEVLQPVEKLDILVNNAGMLISKPFAELSGEEWKQMFEVNLFGTVNLIKALLPKLKASPGAHIVNIGSMGGFQGSSKFPGLSGYSASKAALANLTECLCAELGKYNIKSNCLCLGAVNTEMLARAFPAYKAPLDAGEMADFIAYFCKNGHRFFNGQVLPVALNDPG